MSGGRRHGFPYGLLGVAATGVVTALQNHPPAPFAAGTSRPSGLREEAGATLPCRGLGTQIRGRPIGYRGQGVRACEGRSVPEDSAYRVVMSSRMDTL